MVPFPLDFMCFSMLPYSDQHATLGLPHGGMAAKNDKKSLPSMELVLASKAGDVG